MAQARAVAASREQIWTHAHRASASVRSRPAAIRASRPGCCTNYSHWRPDRHRHDVARLWPVGHAAAAGACLRDHRRLRRRAARCRSCASTRPAARRARRSMPNVCRELIAACSSRWWPQEGTGELARDSRLSRCRQDRHRLEVDRRRLLHRPLSWRCSPAWRRRRIPRLAAVVVIDEPSAGEHMGGEVAAPVFSAHGRRRAAPAGGGARRAGHAPEDAARRSGARQRAHGGTAMSAAASFVAAPRALAELVAGFASVPRQLTVERLTLDSRAVSPGALFLACRGRTHHGLEFAGRGARARRARGAVRARRRRLHRRPRSCRECSSRAVPSLSARAGLIADRFFGAPSQQLTHRRHHRHQRQDHLRVAAGAGAAALRAAGGLHRHARRRSAARRSRRSRHTTPDAVTRAARSSRSCGARAPRASPWKSPRTRSTRSASTACASTPRPSPI